MSLLLATDVGDEPWPSFITAALAAFFFLAVAGCSSTGSTAPPADQAATGTMEEIVPPPAIDPANSAEDEQQQAIIDRTQRVVASVVDNTALWFDGLFAVSEMYPQSEGSSGRLLLGSRWDERDGLKKRVRFAARLPLPALRSRAGLIFGRSDTDDLLDGSESTEIKAIPDEFNDTEEEDWFLGLGYRRRTGLASGFDAGVGVTFASGNLQPYVQANYRWNRAISDKWLVRMRPRVFWRDDRGRGASVTTIFDYFVSRDWLLRSWNLLLTDGNIDGVRWTGKLLAFQSLAGRSAISYSTFATGQTGGEVEVDDYGFEVRFRRRIYREWLFLELSSGVSWPREFLDEQRKSNFAVGADIEMRFGDRW